MKGSFVLFLIGMLAVVGQDAPQRQTPALRTDVELVAVDLVAVTSDGSPIEDLGVDDLVLKVDGRSRSIKSLQFVRTGDVSRAPRSGTDATEPRRTPELLGASRTVLLIIDHESLRQGDGQFVMRGGQRFMDMLSARDRVAVITIPRGRVVVQQTTDHDAARRALAVITGHATSDVDECESGYLARAVLGSLKTILSGLADNDGPTIVILVSGGLLPTTSSADPTRRSRCASMRPTQRDYADVGKAAAGFRGQFYAIEPHSFTSDASERGSMAVALLDDRLRGLEDLVGVVGGQLFRRSGTADSVFERIARESSAYYILGFEPEPSERDGKSHRIEVTAVRRNATVRARPTFTIAKKKAG